MSLSSSSSANPTVHDEQNALSDEDVGLLYLIVSTAQQSPIVEQFPFKALFDAYDTVLRKHELDPDHDAVYLRFLLKLGRVKQEGSLYDKFEALLEENGIHLEFGDEEHAESQVLSSDFSETDKTSVQRSHKETTRSRRASFSSFQDREDGVLVPTQLPGRPSTRASARPSERTHSAEGFRNILEKRDARSRLKTKGRGEKENTNIDLKLPVRSKGAERSAENPPVQASSALTQSTRRRPRVHHDGPSLERLQTFAELLYENRLQSISRRIFRRWYGDCQQIRNRTQDMLETAKRYDRSILLVQAFDTWRSSLRKLMQQAETERFYDNLEWRAQKSRDLFLVTKAFTHWANCAMEEVHRTTVARRHIVRRKCFHAWQEITAVNELKIRRFLMRKYMSRWGQHTRQVYAFSHQADRFQSQRLIPSTFRLWFWKFCEHRTEEVREEKAIRRCLRSWKRKSLKHYKQQVSAEATEEDNVRKRLLHAWSKRLSSIASIHVQSDAHRVESRKRMHLELWKRQSKISPSVDHMSQVVTHRILRGKMQMWSTRTRMEKDSTVVNHGRLKRNAWQSWRERLRMQTMSQRINERVATQCLYHWLVRGRYVLLQRSFDERAKQRYLNLLVSHCRGERNRLQETSQQVGAMDDRRTSRAVLQRWRLQIELQTQRKQLAMEIEQPRLIQKTFSDWKENYEEKVYMANRASDIHHYYTGTSSLRLLGNACAESRRKKRRNAYAQTRRILKRNAARSVLQTWRARSEECSEWADQASEIQQNSVSANAIRLLEHWRTRVVTLGEQDSQADSTLTDRQTRACLHSLKSTLYTYKELNEVSRYHAELRKLNNSAVLLRKLSIIAFQRKNAVQGAEGLNNRNQRKHMRSMLRYWREQTSRRRKFDRGPQIQRHESDVSQSTAKGNRSSFRVDQRSTRAVREPYTENSLGVKTATPLISTPLPGYLSTPSKRAARARSLARTSAGSSTTPKTPLIRSFQQRLRTQYSGDPMSGRRTTSTTPGFGASIGVRSQLSAVNTISEVASQTSEESAAEGDGRLNDMESV